MDQKLLHPGLTVNYVLKNGEVRPLIITRVVTGTKNINGTVLFDGPNDAERLSIEFRLNSDQLRTGTIWLEDVPYNEAPTSIGKSLVPGTWHLPQTMAAAA
jgi:hypothetical protein